MQYINNIFILKRNDKRLSTMKSLGDGRKNKTVKNPDK